MPRLHEPEAPVGANLVPPPSGIYLHRLWRQRRLPQRARPAMPAFPPQQVERSVDDRFRPVLPVVDFGTRQQIGCEQSAREAAREADAARWHRHLRFGDVGCAGRGAYGIQPRWRDRVKSTETRRRATSRLRAARGHGIFLLRGATNCASRYSASGVASGYFGDGTVPEAIISRASCLSVA